MFISRKIGNIEFLVNPSEPTGIYLKESEAFRYNFTSIKDFSRWILGDERIPLVLQWEITSICNFKCKFCYIAGRVEPTKFSAKMSLELVEEFSQLGVVHVILTGGECLLHPNFIEIYNNLKESGIVVSIFSNLEKLSQKHIQAFKQYPPYMIEVSIYGRDEETYQQVTGKRAFSQVLSNVEILQKNGVNVFCKTPVNLLTKDSIQWIRSWCGERNIGYFTSPDVDNGIDGEDLSRFALNEEEYLQEERLRFKQSRGKKTLVENENRNTQIAFSCNAGKSGAYLTYDSRLTPCAGIRDQYCDIQQVSFSDSWAELVKHIESQQSLTIQGCNPSCSAKSICKMCPAKALSGDREKYKVNPEYCKRMIKLSALLKMDEQV